MNEILCINDELNIKFDISIEFLIYLRQCLWLLDVDKLIDRHELAHLLLQHLDAVVHGPDPLKYLTFVKSCKLLN